MKIEEIKQDMINHILSHNKHFPKEYLNNLPLEELIGECHPNYREYYEKKIKDANK